MNLPPKVQSRVQKYFLKLQKAGLPIPGRLPPSRNTYRYFAQSAKKKWVARQPALASSRKSTFFATIVPTVKMEDLDSDLEEGDSDHAEVHATRTTECVGWPQGPISDRFADDPSWTEMTWRDEDWSDEARNSEDFRLLKLLRLVKAEQGTVRKTDLKIYFF
jgi:hypothetical protein